MKASRLIRNAHDQAARFPTKKAAAKEAGNLNRLDTKCGARVVTSKAKECFAGQWPTPHPGGCRYFVRVNKACQFKSL